MVFHGIPFGNLPGMVVGNIINLMGEGFMGISWDITISVIMKSGTLLSREKKQQGPLLANLKFCNGLDKVTMPDRGMLLSGYPDGFFLRKVSLFNQGYSITRKARWWTFL